MVPKKKQPAVRGKDATAAIPGSTMPSTAEERVAKFVDRIADELLQQASDSSVRWTEPTLKSALVESASLLPKGKLKKAILRNIEEAASALCKKVLGGKGKKAAAPKDTGAHALLFDDEVARQVEKAYKDGRADAALIQCRAAPPAKLLRLFAEGDAKPSKKKKGEGMDPAAAVAAGGKLLLLSSTIGGGAAALAAPGGGVREVLSMAREAAAGAVLARGKGGEGSAAASAAVLVGAEALAKRASAVLRLSAARGASSPLPPMAVGGGEDGEDAGSLPDDPAAAAALVILEAALARGTPAGEAIAAAAGELRTLRAAGAGRGAALLAALLAPGGLPSPVADALGGSSETDLWLHLFDAHAAASPPGGGAEDGSNEDWPGEYPMFVDASRRAAQHLRAHSRPADAGAMERRAETVAVPEDFARWLRAAPAGVPPAAIKAARNPAGVLGTCLVRRLDDTQLVALRGAWDAFLLSAAAGGAAGGGGAQDPESVEQLFFVDTDGTSAAAGGDLHESEGEGSDAEGEELMPVGALGAEAAGGGSEDDEDDEDDDEEGEEGEGAAYAWMKNLDDDEEGEGEEAREGEEEVVVEEEEEPATMPKGRAKRAAAEGVAAAAAAAAGGRGKRAKKGPAEAAGGGAAPVGSPATRTRRAARR